MGVAMSTTAVPVLRAGHPHRATRHAQASRRRASPRVQRPSTTMTAWFPHRAGHGRGNAGRNLRRDQDDPPRDRLHAVHVGRGARALAHASATAFDEVGRVPGGWIVAIFAGVLLSAYVTETINIAVIFGVFMMGMVKPRNAGLTEDVTPGIEDFVVILLLPMFFAYTGWVRTSPASTGRSCGGITLLLIVVAVVGQGSSALIAARLTGFGWRESAVIGTLMNTRGLTELIVLDLALEKGVISDALFAMLVIMALVTRSWAVRCSKGCPTRKNGSTARRSKTELDAGAEGVERRVPGAAGAGEVDPHRAAVEARRRRCGLSPSRWPSPSRRASWIARLVRPPRRADLSGGLQEQNKLLTAATNEVTFARLDLMDKGIAARGVAFISANPGADLAAREERGSGPAALDGRSRCWRRATRRRGRGAERGRVRRGGAGGPRGSVRAAERRTTACWCRSGAPSTTGPRSSSARGSRPARARSCGCWARPERPTSRRG